MKLVYTLILSLILFSGFSQQNIRVLFLGNSYTNYNNLPSLVSNIANDLGTPITVDSHTPGGYTLEAHYNDANAINKINQEQWDYVVIQAQSQEPSFPDAQVEANTLPYAKLLAETAYANNPCTQVLFYMTWGRENGDPQWQPISTYEGMQNRLRKGYLMFADSSQASVAPVGMAWKHTRINNPGINLYATDGSHPSMEGSYLAACTIYSSIFRASVANTNYTAGIPTNVADELQDNADIAVLDSLETFHLRQNNLLANFDYTINANQVEFESTSWHATEWDYDFGDMNNSILENPTHTYANQNNTYTVELTASSTCGSDTYRIDITLDNLSIDNFKNLYKFSLEANNLHIESQNKIGKVMLVDMSGNIVFKATSDFKKADFVLPQTSKALYLLVIGNSSRKIYKQ